MDKAVKTGLKLSKGHWLTRWRNILWGVVLCWPAGVFSFNPPVSVFDPQVYGAGNQNWMIDQTPGEEIVVANAEGLLIFNGAQWQLCKSRTSSVIRSVRVIGDRIYSGGYMDFGYWRSLPNGRYDYQSLTSLLEDGLKNDEQCWNILALDDQVLFQTLHQLYLYDVRKNRLEVIPVEHGVNKCFKIGKAIYFQTFRGDLFNLEGMVPRLYKPAEELPKSEIINLIFTEKGLMLISKEQGFFLLQAGRFVPWTEQDPRINEPADYFSATQLRNGDFALGSITRGLFLVSKEGRILHHIHQLNGLSNNTVLAVFEDKARNLWLGLDNGINAVNLYSPCQEYIDKEGILGTVYAAAVQGGKMYIGTNQGLFYRKIASDDEFRLVRNSNGQVWFLKVIDGELFCGHNLGTFIIRDGRAEKVASVLGTWKLEQVEGRKDLLLQGNYEGIHVLKKINGKWEYDHRLEGIDLSARNFEHNSRWIYLYHPSEGLVRYHTDDSFDVVLQKQEMPGTREQSIAYVAEGVHGQVFLNSNGLFRIAPDFTRLIEIGKGPGWSCQDTHRIPKLMGGEEGGIWLICNSSLVLAHLSANDSLIIDSRVALSPGAFKSKYEFENIAGIGNGLYVSGMTNGFLVVDFDRVDQLNKDYDIRINGMTMETQEAKPEFVDLDQNLSFKNQENNISFYFNVPYAGKYQPVNYQFQLAGDRDQWSDWTTRSSAAFYRLKPGNYRFLVRARVGNVLTRNIAELSFRIRPPWYLSTYAKLSYFILFLAMALGINYLYTSIYKGRKQKILEKNEQEMQYLKLRGEQELMKEKNERLKTEIEAKNKELAVTAMSIVKKNEFLIEVRDELNNKNADQENLDKMVDAINTEIENEESWEMLKNAFENVDKDFIRDIKRRHPSLTPNDLKLCTYLRLNMNSKEIASMMNVSVRSMETKRYRLRKKMDLTHDENLVEYILSL